jgi:imidazolonepropionase-like amidohydrolase
MKRVGTAILLIFWLAAGFAVRGQAPSEGTRKRVLFIKGGTVHTMVRGDIQGGCILIEDGKIIKVGKDLTPPPGAAILETSSRWIMPGFVVVQCVPVGMAPLVKEDVDPAVADYLDPFSLEFRVCLASGITTLGPSFDYGLYSVPGTEKKPYSFRNAVIKPAYGRLEGVVIREPGHLYIDVAGLTPSARADLRNLLLKARDFVCEGAKSEPPAELRNYVSVIKGELPVRFKAGRKEDILKVLSFVDEFRVRAQILGAEEGWLLAGEMARRNITAILQPQAVIERDPYLDRPNGSAFRNPFFLKKGGVRFALIPTSPGVTMSGILGGDLLTFPLAGAFAVRGGLEEEDALRAMTVVPADMLGVSQRVGTIEPGKDADIIVCDGNPLDYRSYVEYTILDGEIVYDKTDSSFFKNIPRAKRLF